jgi:hypothetical protein
MRISSQNDKYVHSSFCTSKQSCVLIFILDDKEIEFSNKQDFGSVVQL